MRNRVACSEKPRNVSAADVERRRLAVGRLAFPFIMVEEPRRNRFYFPPYHTAESPESEKARSFKRSHPKRPFLPFVPLTET